MQSGLALALALALVAFGATAVRAASFQVSPTRFEFPLERRFTNYFSVTNNSPQSLRIRVTTAFIDAGPEGDLREVAQSPYNLAPWLVLNPRRFTLGPAERRVVRFSVRPPPELPAGEYRTVVFFEELPPRPEERSTEGTAVEIQVLTRLGITLYGRAGQPAPDVALEDLRAEAAGDAVRLTALVGNGGTAHATVTVTATLVDAAGTAHDRSEQAITVQRDQRRALRLALHRPAAGEYTLHVAGTLDGQPVFTVERPLAVEPASP